MLEWNFGILNCGVTWWYFEGPCEENIPLSLLLENSQIIGKNDICSYMCISIDIITDKDICRHKQVQFLAHLI